MPEQLAGQVPPWAAHATPLPRRRSWPARLVGVALAGGVGWVADTSLLWLLGARVGVPTPIAAAAGFLVAGLVNFLLNRIVFQARAGSRRRQSGRYGLLYLANLALVSTAVPLLTHLLTSGVADKDVRLVLAKVIVTAALLPMNALAYHYWVFADAGPAGGPTAEPET